MPDFAFPAQPPKEALAYFRAKGWKIGFDHRDVWREEHATAFTVAKAMQLDLLRDLREAVDAALEEGTTFHQFQKELKPTLQKRGWWGKAEMTDPLTGKTRTVQLGSPRRLRTIYRTNLRTARAAGQWERIQRTERSHPYLIYELGPSREHRPEHVGWHGLLLRADDPWWQTHMPPNGWGCKCGVRQISKREAARLRRDGTPGPKRIQTLDPETGLPTGHVTAKKIPVRTQAPPLRRRKYVNKRTGEEQMLPAGIDPGWDYNPGAVGRTVAAARRLEQKRKSAHPADAAASVALDAIERLEQDPPESPKEPL